MTDRFTIDKVELSTESEGPDYFTLGEFQVTDTTTGAIVARFPWTLDEPYLTNKFYSGPVDVRIENDEAIARDGTSETRILLPTWSRAIDVDGIAIAPDTDFAALARRVADGQWLYKLFERLGANPQAAQLSDAMTSMAASDDPRERGAAERFHEFLRSR